MTICWWVVIVFLFFLGGLVNREWVCEDCGGGFADMVGCGGYLGCLIRRRELRGAAALLEDALAIVRREGASHCSMILKQVKTAEKVISLLQKTGEFDRYLPVGRAVGKTGENVGEAVFEGDGEAFENDGEAVGRAVGKTGENVGEAVDSGVGFWARGVSLEMLRGIIRKILTA